eukprot:scaffold170180_cov17-Tisochrysis_lutea.AAC.1
MIFTTSAQMLSLGHQRAPTKSAAAGLGACRMFMPSTSMSACQAGKTPDGGFLEHVVGRNGAAGESRRQQ